jgi:transcriptional regulator with XRE-family HTH domain
MKKANDNRWIADLTTNEEGRRVLERERVWVEATENLSRLMATERVSRADLARRLGVARSTVTEMLSGERNLTLATLTDAFFALGRSMHITYGQLTDRIQVVDEAELQPLQLELWDWTREYDPGAQIWNVSGVTAFASFQEMNT